MPYLGSGAIPSKDGAGTITNSKGVVENVLKLTGQTSKKYAGDITCLNLLNPRLSTLRNTLLNSASVFIIDITF